MAFETLGPWSKATKNFVRDFGQRLGTLSGNGRSVFFKSKGFPLPCRGEGSVSSIRGTLLGREVGLEEILINRLNRGVSDLTAPKSYLTISD